MCYDFTTIHYSHNASEWRKFNHPSQSKRNLSVASITFTKYCIYSKILYIDVTVAMTRRTVNWTYDCHRKVTYYSILLRIWRYRLENWDSRAFGTSKVPSCTIDRQHYGYCYRKVSLSTSKYDNNQLFDFETSRSNIFSWAKLTQKIEVSIPHSPNHFKYEMIDKILSKYLDFFGVWRFNIAFYSTFLTLYFWSNTYYTSTPTTVPPSSCCLVS